MTNRSFGSIRALASGRWQVRYRPTHAAPIVQSFDSIEEAEEFVELVRKTLTETTMTAEQINDIFRQEDSAE